MVRRCRQQPLEDTLLLCQRLPELLAIGDVEVGDNGTTQHTWPSRQRCRMEEEPASLGGRMAGVFQCEKGLAPLQHGSEASMGLLGTLTGQPRGRTAYRQVVQANAAISEGGGPVVTGEALPRRAYGHNGAIPIQNRQGERKPRQHRLGEAVRPRVLFHHAERRVLAAPRGRRMAVRLVEVHTHLAF